MSTFINLEGCDIRRDYAEFFRYTVKKYMLTQNSGAPITPDMTLMRAVRTNLFPGTCLYIYNTLTLVSAASRNRLDSNIIPSEKNIQ